MAIKIKATGKPSGNIAMSGGHFGVGTGASGFVDEVTQAWKMCKDVAVLLRQANIEVFEYYDNSSKNKEQNLTNIVNWHNKQKRVLDVSFHLNAFANEAANGCEILYYDAKNLASLLAGAISQAGNFTNRGAKERKELHFLRATRKKAILIETFFVTNKQDVVNYKKNYDAIIFAKAQVLAKEVGVSIERVESQVKENVEQAIDTPIISSSVLPEVGVPLKFASRTLTESTQSVLDEFVKQGIIGEERSKKFVAGTMTDVEAIGILFHALKLLKDKGAW